MNIYFELIKTMKKLFLLMCLSLSSVFAFSQWTSQTSGTTEYLQSVYFTDADTGYTVGSNGTILKTSNGGTNWTAQTSGTTNFLSSVYFTDPNTGYVVGSSGTILKTNNGGVTFIEETGSLEPTFSIYPNPSQGMVNLKFNNTQKKQIDVFSILGNSVYSEVRFWANDKLLDVQKLKNDVFKSVHF